MTRSGVIVADKPAGMTSHDVVAKVKRLIGAKKVGHLGSLDPLATGVLPLVVNDATKLARFIEGDIKEYECTMRLGSATDTYDSEGKTTDEGDWSAVTGSAVTGALKGQFGIISQVPPMYSAVKVGGTPLYKLARAGKVVERAAKEVRVSLMEIRRVALPDVEFTVRCSRGTYVRNICHDAGVALGCFAHLTALRRTLSASFTIDEAHTLDEGAEALVDAIIPPSALFERLKAVAIGSDEALEIRRGLQTARKAEGAMEPGFFASLSAGEMVRFMHGTTLVALARYEGDGVFKVEKVFK